MTDHAICQSCPQNKSLQCVTQSTEALAWTDVVSKTTAASVAWMLTLWTDHGKTAGLSSEAQRSRTSLCVFWLNWVNSWQSNPQFKYDEWQVSNNCIGEKEDNASAMDTVVSIFCLSVLFFKSASLWFSGIIYDNFEVYTNGSSDVKGVSHRLALRRLRRWDALGSQIFPSSFRWTALRPLDRGPTSQSTAPDRHPPAAHLSTLVASIKSPMVGYRIESNRI